MGEVEELHCNRVNVHCLSPPFADSGDTLKNTRIYNVKKEYLQSDEGYLF